MHGSFHWSPQYLKKFTGMAHSTIDRPISVTSVPGKVMEQITQKHIFDYLETNLQLSPNQFGFRPGRSTRISFS